MVLFVNACVRKESRTKRIADRLLAHFTEEIEEIRLSDLEFPKTDEDFLNYRDACIATSDFSDPYFEIVRQFAKADTNCNGVRPHGESNENDKSSSCRNT